MRVSASRFSWLLGAMCALSLAGPTSAALVETVQLNTAPLIGHAAGPFSLDFQFNGSAGNMATLSSFSFGGGGGPVGVPTLVGGTAGDLSSTVTLTDTNFLNEFTQGFTPGDVLSFDLSLTGTAPAVGFPDEFTFAILDRAGAELPTTGFSDVFLNVDITQNASAQSFGSDPARTPVAGGPALEIAPPGVVSTAPVPEPSTMVLCAAVVCVLLARVSPRTRPAVQEAYTSGSLDCPRR